MHNYIDEYFVGCINKNYNNYFPDILYNQAFFFMLLIEKFFGIKIKVLKT